MTSVKTIGITLFAADFGAPACYTHLMVMRASFQDHRKFLSILIHI